ncbi:peptidase, S9A/B/C family, catalytic domain protein [Leptospira ryugenii]|uniref:Peptidase, S9A/B/C family, catalytic domain protein n=1 Tax=Leptospira ryugenii TaxID=1917863 RepID=A0A2P2DZR2_9LEPT|nr:alpha/beta hydrolase [Leptospira ryugenii]GBF50107.1 peptidase, S9A/B/C family, catalytic domain protein [Leptospira ryugenii]
MKKILKKLTLLFAVFAIILLGAGFYFSSEIISFRKRTLLEDQTNLKIKNVSDFGLPVPKEISFQSMGLVLKGWHFANPNSKGCGIITLHGITGTRWGGLKYAPYFWKKGCDVFAYDARRHGESEGIYGTYGFYEKNDLASAHKTFSEITNIPKNRIGIVGESYGAATALLYVSGRPDVQFVLADSPFKSFHSIIAERAEVLYGKPILLLVPIAIAIAEWRADFDEDEISILDAAKGINIPSLLVHSESDDYTMPSHSKEIEENIATKKKKLYRTKNGAGHAKSILVNREEYERTIDEFITNYSVYGSQ